jgi:hypothetical protein
MFESVHQSRFRWKGVGRSTDLNEVNFAERVEGLRFDNVEDGDDVFVLEMSEEFDLSEGT